MNTKKNASDREFILTRLLNAPRELVFEVWTNPEHVKHWWGPEGFTNSIHEMNVSPGGIWRFMMHGPDGRDYPNKIIFMEVVKPERLVYKQSGEEDFEPVNFHVVVTFEEVGEKTLLTMHSIFPSKEELDFVIKEYKADEGAIQHLNRLEEYLARTKNS